MQREQIDEIISNSRRLISFREKIDVYEKLFLCEL